MFRKRSRRRDHFSLVKSSYARRLRAELLEDRRMLAGVAVGNALDVTNGDTNSISALVASDGGDGISLREAIAAANNTSGSDTITFDSAVFNGEAADVIRLQSGQLTISESVHIDGGFHNVVISGDTSGDDVLVSGTFVTDVPASDIAGARADNVGRVLNVNAPGGSNVQLTGLTLTGGNSSGIGGGIRSDFTSLQIDRSTIAGNTAGGRGGGIFAAATLTDSTVSGNVSNAGGGGIASASGTITVNRSTISGNVSADSGGGISSTSGNVELTNSTLSGNQSEGNFGGGLFNSNGSVTIDSSTITLNSSTVNGGGVVTFGATTFNNSIIVGNIAPGDAADAAGTGSNFTGSFNLLGFSNVVAGANNRGSITDAGLGPLVNNGGPTPTHALLTGSLALDRGSTTLMVDQRGVFRPIDNPTTAADGSSSSDIGAVEQDAIVYQVTTLDDEIDSLDIAINTVDLADLSLREAVGLAINTPGDVVITFAPELSGQTIFIHDGFFTETLVIDRSLTIDGDLDNDGVADITVSADSSLDADDARGGVFQIAGSADVILDGLVVRDGNSIGNFSGTGIQVGANSSLVLANSAVLDNSSTLSGGGIAAFGDVTIVNSTISGNTSGFSGGGVYARSANVTFIGSTISNNTANSFGGGISVQQDVKLVNSTVSNNSGSVGGVDAAGSATLFNSTVSGNAGSVIGGVFAQNTLTLTNSIVLGNATASALTNTEVQQVDSFIGQNIVGSSPATFNASYSPNAINALADAVFAQTVANSADPSIRSGVLGNNGGTVPTIALLDSVSNVALDAAPASVPLGVTLSESAIGVDLNSDGDVVDTLTTTSDLRFDQRQAGFNRSVDQTGIANNGTSTQDIGAVELQSQASTQTLAVSTVSELGSALANPSVTVIELATDIDFPADYFNGGAAFPSEFTVNRDLTIDGNGFTFQAAGGSGVASTSRSFLLVDDANLTLNELGFSNPAAIQADAIALDGGTLTGTNLRFENIGATGGTAGAIGTRGTQAVTITLSNSGFTGNQSQAGAAISVDTAGSIVRIDQSAFTGNQAVNGGSIFAASGVFVRLADTTFSGNTATGQGGAIQLQGSAALISDSLTFSNNTATTGGAISNDSGGANVQVFDTRFVDNVATNTGQLTVGGTAVNVDTDNIAFGLNSIVNVARSTNGTGNTPITTINDGGVFGIFAEADFGATTATLADFVPSGGGAFVAEEIAASVSPATVEEGALATFTLTLPPLFASATSGVDVFFALSGAATFNSDFVLSPNANSLGNGLFRVNVPAGTSSVNISATIINDIQFESAEQIILTLQNPTALVGGALAYAVDESAPATTATINANGPPAASLVATSSILTEGAAFDDLTVQLTTAAIQNTTIFFAIEAGSASLADVSFTGTVVVPQGATSAVVPISAFDDAITEFDESFSVRLLDDPAATTSYELSTTAPTSQSLTIAENDTDLLFNVSLSAVGDPNLLTVVEGETSRAVLVNLTDPVTGAPSVAPAGGFEVSVTLTGFLGAVAGVDFVNSLTSVVVPAGQSSTAIPIVTLDDNFDQENNGLVIANLVGPVREESRNYNVDSNNELLNVTIVDNDVAGVIIQQLDTTTTEAGGTAQFAVTLTAEPTDFVVVFLDFPGISSAIPNDEIASQTVTNFPEIDGFSRDFIDATIGARFFLPSFATMDRGADFNPTFAGSAPDLGNYVIFAPSSGTLGDPTGTFFDALPISNFSGNQSNPFNQTQIITLTGIDDLLLDGNQTISITPAVEEFGGAGLLAMLGSPFDPFNNLSPGQGITLLDADGQAIPSLQLTNFDNDVPVVLVSDVAGQADEANAATTASYTLQLSQPTSSPVQIAINVGSQAEVSVDDGLTFDTLASVTVNDTNPRSILVRALDDTSIEGLHSETITHSIISGSAEYPVGQSIALVSVNINDNDLPTVSIGQIANASEQTAVAGQVGVVLDVPAPSGGVSVNFTVNASGASNAATPGTDFQALTGTLTIAEGQTGGFINVQPFFDLIDELPLETVEITLASGPGYNISSSAPVTGTVNIFDDDQAEVRIVESAAATRILEGGTETYEIFLTSQPQSDVTVTLNLAPGSTVTPIQTTFTFTPANFDTPQIVTLSLADNIIPGQSRIETITHSVTSSDANYNGITANNVNIQVIDTDIGGFATDVSDGLTVAENGSLLDTYVFTLLAPPTEDVTIQLGVATKIDGQPNVTFGNAAGDTFTELFFEAGSTANLSRTIFVRGVNDNIDEDNRTVDITHTIVTDDAFLASQTIDNIQVTVSEDDVAGVTLTPSGGGTSVTQGSGFDEIVVTLDTQPRAPVTINFDTGTSLNPIAPITIDPANFPGSVTVQVSAPDTGQLGIQSVPLSLSVDSADTAFDILQTSTLDVTVVDAQLRNDFATGLNSLLTTIDGFVASTLNFQLPLFDVGTANPEFISVFIDEVVAAFVANGEVELGLLGGPLESAIQGAFAAAGVTLDATVTPIISAGEISFAVSLGNTFDTTVPLLADFGVPALGLNVEGSINPSFTYQLDLAFGVNGTDRFFVDTAATGISASLSAGLSDDFTASGNLGFIGFSAQNQTNDDGEGVTAASVNFSASLNDINTNDSATRLSLAELQSTAVNNLFSVNFDAGATIGLSAEATLGENTVLPSLLFDFDGQFNALSLNDQNQFVIGAAPSLAFNNISVDTGSLISNFAGPIFSRIDAVLEPFRPVLDLLNTDLSVVRELGITQVAGNNIDANGDGQVMLLELLQAIPGSNINLIGFQDALNALDSLVMTIAAFGEAGENITIDLGSFELALPQTGFAVGPNDPGFAAVQSGIQNNSTSTANNVSTQIANSGSSPARAGILNNLATNPVFQFPILTDVEQAFGLLTGQTDAVLFQATLPSIDIGADLSVDFDILEILEGNFSGNAGISSQFTFGFDTQGFFDFVESGFDPSQSFRIFDGFFLADTDADGEDVPELTAGFGFSGSVSIDAGFLGNGSLAAGIEGEATVDFRDTGESLGEGDGRIRAISEIAANITSPQNLFNLAGSLNAFLRANATVLGIQVGNVNIAEELFSFEFGEDGLEISTAFDGPLTGARVFFDANFNGIQDANEPFSVSGVDPANPDQGAFQLAIPLEAFDDNGNGVIDPAEGRIVVSGGFDVDTGDIQVVPFTTSTEFSVASPLTLLTLELAPVDLNAVESAVETSLGLPAAFNLQTGNPLAGIRAGDADSAQVFGRLAQLQNLIILSSNTLGSAFDATPTELFTSNFTTQTGDTRASGAVQILNQLASLINSPATIDLTNATQLRSIIEGAAAAAGVTATGLDAAIVDLVTRNTAISAVAGSGETARAAIVGQVALSAADSSYGFTLENLFSRLIGVSTPAPDTTSAAQTVASALGILAAVDIRSFNTFQEIDNGNIDAAQVLAAQTQINSTLVQLAAITSGGTGTGTEAAALNALVQAVGSSTSPLDLTNAATIQVLITTISPSIDPAVATSAATAIANSNQQIQDLANNAAAGNGLGGLRTQVATVQTLAQGGQTDLLNQLAGGQITPESLPELIQTTATAGEDAVTQISVNEDAVQSGNLLSEAAAAINQTLTVTAVLGDAANIGVPVTLPSGAIVIVNADGSYTVNPNGQFEALNTGQIDVDSFAFTVAGGNGAIVQASATVTINGVTDPPTTPQSFIVTTTADEFDAADISFATFDSGNPQGSGLSLREAISLANVRSGFDTITFDPSVFGAVQVIGLTSQLPTIVDTVAVTGPGADLLTLDAGNGADNTFSTGDGFRLLNIDDGSSSQVEVTISGLTLTGGDTSTAGGAIFNRENLTIVASQLLNNSALTSAGGNGGGIENNFGTLDVQQSTFAGNAANAGGGILNNGGSLTVSNSTFSGNSAAVGGGIANNETASSFSIDSSTILGNTAFIGGGIFSLNPASINNTIVAGSVSGGDLAGGGTLSGGFNLIQDGGNLSGLTDTVIADPQLAALTNNGGPTLTHALLPGSSAIDAGNPVSVAGQNGVPLFDQRGTGFDRVKNGRIDIGAFEAEAPAADFDTDGDIDGSDFLAWQRGFGTPNATPADGDADNDSDVDAADLTIWQSQFGQTTPSSPLAAATANPVNQGGLGSRQRVVESVPNSAISAALADVAIALFVLEDIDSRAAAPLGEETFFEQPDYNLFVVDNDDLAAKQPDLDNNDLPGNAAEEPTEEENLWLSDEHLELVFEELGA